MKDNQLTLSELDILSRLANGFISKHIAEDMGYHPATVERKKKTIRNKLGAKTIQHAVALGIMLGIVEVKE